MAACEVTVKGIKSRVMNEVVNKFPSGKPNSLNTNVFIPYTSKNRGDLFSDVNKVMNTMNIAYNATEYGNIVTSEALEFGVNIVINPTERLADDMTTQNYNDEYKKSVNDDFYLGDEALRDQEMSSPRRRKNEQEGTPQKPVTDNFAEFASYKEAQLEVLNTEISELNREAKDPPISTIETQKKLRTALLKRSTVEEQLDDLRKNEVNLMFHAIVTELDGIEEALKDPATMKGEDIKNTLRYFNQMMTGVVQGNTNIATETASIAEFNHPDYKDLFLKLVRLEEEYIKAVPIAAQEIIFNNPIIQRNILGNEEIDEEELFTPRRDISNIDKFGYGVNESFSDNTIIPQVMYTEQQRISLEESSTVQKMILGLRDFLKKSNLKNFDFIFEKDDKGRSTGYITNVFAPPWYNALKGYDAKYIGFLKDKNATNYRSTINWLKGNANLIDFRKLKEFKETYGEVYAEHFTYDDIIMDKYEANLKAQLGPRYDKIISQIHDRLANFEHVKEAQLATSSRFKFSNIASKDIWAFNKAFHDGSNATKKVFFNAGASNTEETFFTDFGGLTFIPKETKTVASDQGVDEQATGYYSENFKGIMKDPNKLEYWNRVEEMSGYINNTYKSEFHDRMSYPKVLFDLKEKLVQAGKSPYLNKLGVFKQAALWYKEKYYEKGRFSEGKSIVANYSDSTNKEARVLAETYQQQGMDRKEALAEAKAKVLERYSTDINRDLNAILLQAALHRTRIRVEPIVRSLEDYFKTIRTSKEDGNKERTKAIRKLNGWMERIIYNRTEKYRGGLNVLGADWTVLQKAGKNLSKIPFLGKHLFSEKSFSFLSDPEKVVMTKLEELKREGYDPAASFQIPLEGSIFIKEGDEYYERVKATETLITIDKELFDTKYEQSLINQIDTLGIEANLAGFIQGFLKVKIIASLGLNFSSGLFNRIEGKISGLMMDMVGEYWTKGNINDANQFLVGANMLKYTPDIITPKWTKKYKEMEKLKALQGTLITLQDRKNVLERSAESANFDTSKLNIYQFTVENPEFKNQMAIAVSIMMDRDITHPITGKTTKMFANGEFPAHNLVDGQLVLKEEYRSVDNVKNYEDFNGTEALDLKLKITNAINRSQGNYDPNDVIMLTESIYGRALSLFMKWLPAQVKQRYAEGKGDDIYTGKKDLQGRYVATVRGSKTMGVLTPIISLSVMWATFGIPLAAIFSIGIIGGSALKSMVFHKIVHEFSSKDEVKREANIVREGLDFFHSILVEFMNFPLDITNISGVKINGKKLRFKDTHLTKREYLTPHQAQSIQATAKELAVMIQMLSAKLALAQMFFDPDDREDDEERMRYYWLQNQLTKAIKAVGMYSDPITFFSDTTRIAVMGAVQDLFLTLSAIWDEDEREDFGKNATNLLAPIPKSLLRDEMPWEDTKDYNMFTGPFGSSSSLKWTAVHAKDAASDGEYSEEKTYRGIRKDIREDITEEMRDLGYRGQALTDKIDEVIDERYGNKDPDENYKKTVERFESRVKRYE